MKRNSILFIFTLICSTSIFAQIDSSFTVIQEHFSRIEQSLNNVKVENEKLKLRIAIQEGKMEMQDTVLSSLKSVVISNIEDVKTKVNQLGTEQDRTNASLQTKANVVELKSKMRWGVCALILLLVVLVVFYISLHKRVKTGTFSIDEVRKAQDALQAAHAKMQEESVKLDNRLIELFERQMPSAISTASVQIDHSLALKVADEIVRIEMNLLRMDPSVKGYKQLSKAVQRIKDNFNANGYEIVDMLGKSYVAGMKAAVTFVIDENLEPGQQIVTKIIKPQINYQQQMIQAAQIEVSQSE